MEFIVFFVTITLIALGTQLACYAVYRRKTSFAIPPLSHGMAADPS